MSIIITPLALLLMVTFGVYSEMCPRKITISSNRRVTTIHDEEWKDEVWRQKAVTYASSNPCPICGMIFPIQSMLNEHLAKIHEDPEAMELQCTYCTNCFPLNLYVSVGGYSIHVLTGYSMLESIAPYIYP